MKKINSKKALAPIVATVILIAITVALAGLILGIVKPFATDNLDDAERCFDIQEKIQFNHEYTCYNATGDYMQISISQEEIDIDGLLIAIVSEEGTKGDTFLLSSTPGPVENIKYLNGTTEVGIPGKEAGQTYIFSGIISEPTQISLAPIIGKESCLEIDNTYNIRACFQ
mgnify:CR=1 FL=1